MFVGSPRARLDDKGRVVLPAKYRDQLAGGVVITKGQEGCLYVFPTATFQQIAEQAAAASAARPASRAAQRMLFAGAVDEVPDRQGRVTLSAALREYAGLDRNVTVVGNNNRLEIWESAAWDTYEAEQSEQFAQLSEEVLPGIF